MRCCRKIIMPDSSILATQLALFRGPLTAVLVWNRAAVHTIVFFSMHRGGGLLHQRTIQQIEPTEQLHQLNTGMRYLGTPIFYGDAAQTNQTVGYVFTK